MAYYNQQSKEYQEDIIHTKRVSKKTTGGNKIGFTALVVVGNKKGKVGAGLGKAPDISAAIQKGIKKAKEEVVSIVIKNGSVPHEVINTYKSSTVKIMPAPEGSGVIAGGAVRKVLELAGYTDVSAKLIGSNNKHCSVISTIQALQKLKGDIQVEEEVKVSVEGSEDESK